MLSDHGESLGEHGETAHGYFIYESTLHVPLLIHWPSGGTDHAPRDSQPGGLMDVAPSILDFLHIPAPPSFEGRSLLAANGPHQVYSESVYAHDAFGWAPLRITVSGGYGYIEARRPELH